MGIGLQRMVEGLIMSWIDRLVMDFMEFLFRFMRVNGRFKELNCEIQVV